MFFQGLCKRRTKLRGSTYHNWRRDSIFLFFKFSSPFSQMTYCWKGDKSNLPKNQYKTKLYSHQTSSVLNEYIKYHTAFCILDLYAVYRGVLPPNLSSYALMYEIYIIHTYIYIHTYVYTIHIYIYVYIYIYTYPQTRVSPFPGLISVARVNEYIYILYHLYTLKYNCIFRKEMSLRQFYILWHWIQTLVFTLSK